jgi:two-component system OmpR family response regulator/two-component system response regulator QseB
MRLLLVEDDTLLAQGLCTALERKGYQLSHCDRGDQAILAIETQHFDLMILDLGLPDGHATQVIRHLRLNKFNLPIIVLTAWDQLSSKLDALDLGADDYLVKPIHVDELEARIRALMRRRFDRTDDVLRVGHIEANLSSHQCTVEGQAVSLTPREWILLKEFMQSPQRLISKRHLEDLCYGWTDGVESNALEVHISHLRKKIGANTLRTIRGLGYMMVTNSNE